MNLAVLGINFRTAPIELREKAAYTPDVTPAGLRSVCEEFPDAEAVLLSTCNRTELYTVGIDAETNKSALVSVLLKGAVAGALADADRHFYVKMGLAAAEHLLTVAASLDSMVVGETEILGQVKQAYTLATQARTNGRGLDAAFHTAFRVAKRVHSETDISRGRVSVSSIAVEFAEKVFENLAAKTVMIVGAGETAELALKSLVERGARDVLVLNRSLERAQALAERHGGRALSFDLLDDRLAHADIVISSTSAPHCVIREAAVRRAMGQRRGQPLLLIDIAVPRDIEASIGDVKNVYLYHIDDLQRVADENLSRRHAAVESAWRIVREGAAELAASLEEDPLRDLMRRLDAFGRETADAVLARTLAKERMAALPEETREEVRMGVNKVVNKLLAGPREALKRASRNGQWEQYARVVNDLFRFNDKHGAE